MLTLIHYCHHWVAKNTFEFWDNNYFMSYLCTFILYVLGCSHPCSSHIFWPPEHIFCPCGVVSCIFCIFCPRGLANVVLLLDTFKWRVRMKRSWRLSFLFMRNSPCLICPWDTAWALVSPAFFSCVFHMFSNTLPQWSYSLDLLLQWFLHQFISL